MVFKGGFVLIKEFVGSVKVVKMAKRALLLKRD